MTTLNELRKMRLKDAEQSLAVYAPRTEGYDTAIVDALANLRHLCDAKGLEFHYLDHQAYDHYIIEANEVTPERIPPPVKRPRKK